VAHLNTDTAPATGAAESRQPGARSSWLPYSRRRVAIVAALWLLALIILLSMTLTLHARPSTLFPGDVGLLLLIQRIKAPPLVAFINLASDANWPTPAGIIVFATLLVFVIFRRWRYAVTTLIAGFIADGAGFALNGWVARPRPNNVHIHAVKHIGLSSFPSGHVSHVTAFYGFLLFLTLQELRVHPRRAPGIRIVQAVCVYFLVFIGLSRLLEGEHWPSDVLASYLLGGMALVVVILIYQALGRVRVSTSGIHKSDDAAEYTARDATRDTAEYTARNTAEDTARDAAEDTARTARRAAGSPVVTALAHAGYAAKGAVYLIIGALALAAALHIGGGLTDQAGATRVIYHQPFGAFLLILAAVGWLGYGLWCLIQSVFDTAHYGTDAKGIVARVGYAWIGVIYGGLAVLAFELATGKSGGKSSDAQAHDWTARLLAAPAGVALVVLVGVVTLVIAGVLFYRAYSAEFRRQLDLAQAPDKVRTGVILLGRVGYAALGCVFTIIGVFFIVAALRHDPSQAKGLSGALAVALRGQFGGVLLAIIALGLLAYGVYSLAQARYRRIRVA
jgi:membrane-associated phospholipid phosphatase